MKRFLYRILLVLSLLNIDLVLAAEIDYDNICGNSGVSSAMVIVGYIIQIAKWIAPLIIIVLGMVDYGKASISNDEKAINKATAALVRRIVAGIVIFFVPTIISAFTKNILKTDIENEFLSCTNCMFNPGICQEEVKLLKEQEKEQAIKDREELEKEQENNTTKPIRPDTGFPNNEDIKIASKGQGLWVAHQKNNSSAVAEAIKEGFWGIEVDVHQSGDTFQLYHDSKKEPYSGYDLDEFLDTCKANNITAILDFKYVKDVSKLVSLVKEKNMQENTIYQTWWGAVQNIYNADNNARIWVLISDGNYDVSQVINDLKSVKEYVEGVNMFAKNVDQKDIQVIHDLGLTFCAFSYASKLYDNADANTLRSWGTNYIMANNVTPGDSNNINPGFDSIQKTKNISINYYNNFSYWLYLPDKVVPNLPIVVYLPGLGERGNDYKTGASTGITWGPINEIKDYNYSYNAIIIHMQVPSGASVYNYINDYIKLIDKIADEYSANKNKISVIGFSHGCYGIINLITAYPNYFSAVVPIGCAPNKKNDLSKFINQPVWTFVGGGDGTSDYSDQYGSHYSLPNFDAEINKLGGNAKHTSVKDKANVHNILNDSYSILRDKEYNVINWMISQTK